MPLDQPCSTLPVMCDASTEHLCTEASGVERCLPLASACPVRCRLGEVKCTTPSEDTKTLPREWCMPEGNKCPMRCPANQHACSNRAGVQLCYPLNRACPEMGIAESQADDGTLELVAGAVGRLESKLTQVSASQSTLRSQQGELEESFSSRGGETSNALTEVKTLLSNRPPDKVEWSCAIGAAQRGCRCQYAFDETSASLTSVQVVCNE